MVGFVGAKCEDTEMQSSDENSNLNNANRLKRNQQQQQQQQQLRQNWSGSPTTATITDSCPASPAPHEPEVCKSRSPDMEDDIDEEQLKRILACKRLSEGNCNRHLASLNVCRKNSLHMIGESLPPVTEGEPMRHMSRHMSQTAIEHSSQSSSTSSSSLRGGAGLRHLANGNKRYSQDENATSCSSSTSLDGSGPRSPTRRRSSTVSQCSSVLSEGTRQQLNFDLSPDLAPDSSILEANAISPTDSDRPASPEPSSLGSHTGSLDMRPMSRMSTQFCDEILTDTPASPDSMLGDQSTENQAHTNNHHQHHHQAQQQQAGSLGADNEHDGRDLTGAGAQVEVEGGSASVARNLERIITHVSEVKVSSVVAGQKRAHTPFGANIQRSKATHIES